MPEAGKPVIHASAEKSDRASLQPDGMRERYASLFESVRTDSITLTPDVARLLVHWLGDYARLKQQPGQPGVPEGLAATQCALAEAVARVGDSRRREQDGLGEPEAVAFEHEQCMGTAEAAAELGVSADTVRWHCRKGNLDGKRVGRQLMVTGSSVEALRVRLTERKGA